MTQHMNEAPGDFFSFGIAPGILESLERMKIKVPTPIQFKAIPAGLEGKDIIGVAQTGTGKTLAFAIPIIQRLAGKHGKALILVPTRELAIQVEESFRKVAPHELRSAVLIGGASMQDQIRAVRKGARVIIATPGRLNDHIERRIVNLSDAGIVVLDEADRMLDMGFKPQIESILKVVPTDRQTLLFSATIPSEIMGLASRYMKLPVCIEIAISGTVAERVTQELFIVKKDDKKNLLEKLLAQYRGSVLIFSRTKRGAAKTTKMIKAMGFSAAEIHSDRTLAQRKDALEGFKSGRYRVLVATDIAARGIDVVGIELVINYDLPEDAENYVHRIGRTGRAERKGHAVSLATPDQADEVRKIERMIRTNLPISKHPEVPGEVFTGGPSKTPSYKRGARDNKFGRDRYGKPGVSRERGAGYDRPRAGGDRPSSGFAKPRSFDKPRVYGKPLDRKPYRSGPSSEGRGAAGAQTQRDGQYRRPAHAAEGQYRRPAQAADGHYKRPAYTADGQYRRPAQAADGQYKRPAHAADVQFRRKPRTFDKPYGQEDHAKRISPPAKGFFDKWKARFKKEKGE